MAELNKTINRAKLRGKPLDSDCKKAYITRHEYGLDDPRRFCFGLCDPAKCYDTLPKCVECKAYVGNAEPWKDGEQE